MDRTRKLRLVCGLMAALYALVAIARLGAGALPLIDPALSVASINCKPVRCWIDADPVRLIEKGGQTDAFRTPQGRARLQTLMATGRTRTLLFAGAMVRAVPSFLLFLCLALAFCRFAGGKAFDPVTIKWLRRAAAAAIAVVVAQPFADSLAASAFSSLLTGRQQIFIAFNGGPFFWGLLLAGAVWVSVWALEQARFVQAELAEIV